MSYLLQYKRDKLAADKKKLDYTPTPGMDEMHPDARDLPGDFKKLMPEGATYRSIGQTWNGDFIVEDPAGNAFLLDHESLNPFTAGLMPLKHNAGQLRAIMAERIRRKNEEQAAAGSDYRYGFVDVKKVPGYNSKGGIKNSSYNGYNPYVDKRAVSDSGSINPEEIANPADMFSGRPVRNPYASKYIQFKRPDPVSMERADRNLALQGGLAGTFLGASLGAGIGAVSSAAGGPWGVRDRIKKRMLIGAAAGAGIGGLGGALLSPPLFRMTHKITQAYPAMVATPHQYRDAVSAYRGYNPYFDKNAYGTWVGNTFIGRDDRIQPRVEISPVDWFGTLPKITSAAGGVLGGLAGYNYDEGSFLTRDKTRKRLLNAALGAVAGAGAGFAGGNLLNLAATGYRHLQNATPVISFPVDDAGMSRVPYYKTLTGNPAMTIPEDMAPGYRTWGDLAGRNKASFAHIPL